MNAPARKLRSRDLQARSGVVGKTLGRWVKGGVLPEPMRINRLRYWDEAELDRVDSARGSSPLLAQTTRPFG